jgi:hypothetical protein
LSERKRDEGNKNTWCVCKEEEVRGQRNRFSLAINVFQEMERQFLFYAGDAHALLGIQIRKTNKLFLLLLILLS